MTVGSARCTAVPTFVGGLVYPCCSLGLGANLVAFPETQFCFVRLSVLTCFRFSEPSRTHLRQKVTLITVDC